MSSGTNSLSSGGVLSSGSELTLVAAVTSGATNLTTGQVNFCDAAAKICTDIHLLGTAQLTHAGTAVLRFHPGIGSHSYKAVFVGTPNGTTAYAASTSSIVTLTVTGTYPTTTTITQTGNLGNYTLTSMVTGIVNGSSVPAPTGSVSFLDTTTSNSVLGTASLGSATVGLSLLNSSTAKLTQEANAVATADFNGDGIPDLAVSDSNSGQVLLAILLGNGDGTFTATPTSPTVGLYPDSIAVGDFNSDGIPDLAVTSVDQNLVTILLGNGDGTFTAAPNLNTSSTPQSVATGDFNQDGIADLAVVNANLVLIFQGRGDGTFTALASPSTGASPITVAVGDFNGDGISDLAVTNSCGASYPCNNNNGTVTIIIGKGDGTFPVVLASPVAGASPDGLAIADFNGDGILDLAVSNYGGISSNAVTVFLGNGNGTFKTGVANSAPGLNFKSLAVADFNGDGIPDLAAGEFWHGELAILLGNGDGTFAPAMGESAVAQLGSGYIAAADFNGDGIADLVVPSQDGTVPILLTQPTKTATATVSSISPTGPGPHQVDASYPGDSNFTSSISSTTPLTVQVATPIISPGGGTYTSIQTVSITDATPGAAIYYSASGALQTNGFVQYTGPVALSNQGYTSIQAYATETGYQQSSYETAAFTLNLPSTAKPSISLASGAYPSTQTVTISDTTPGAAIYYTTNGSLPTANSAQYTGPITVASSEALVATALAYGYSMSPPASAQYVIGSSSSSFIYTVAGNGNPGYSGDGSQATSADMNSPGNAVMDAAGNLYISDSNNNVVRKVAAGTGIISTIAGNRTAGFSGDGGVATSAQLSSPTGLALDGAGNLYISDILNNRIRKVAAGTGIISTYAGNGTLAYSGDNGPAISAGISYPAGIVMDAAGNLYIAESGSERIRKVAASTGTITTVAGNGQYGYTGDGGAATSAELRDPTGVALDLAGNLYISDTYNNVVRKVAAGTGIITTVAGNGTAGYTGDGGPATGAELYLPYGVAVDTVGNLYVADTYNVVVRKVTTSNGTINTVAGNGNAPACYSLGADGGAATSAALCYPQSVSVDNTGNLYIADTSRNRIRMVTAVSSAPTTATAAPTFTVSGGTYNSPQVVTITDSTPGAAIYVTMDGTPPFTFSPGYRGPINVTGGVTISAVAVAPGYLTSTSSTATYTITSPPTDVITTIAGDGVHGFSGVGGPPTSAEFGTPQGTALDSAGNLYFSDTDNNVVWMLSAQTGNLSVVAGNGTPGYSGDGGPAGSAQLNSPHGVASDNAGNLYIADSGNNVVRKIVASTGLITTVVGTGGSGNMGDGGPATAARLYHPSSIVFDNNGNLYIADTYNSVVRRVSASTGIITTVAGNGSYGSSGDGGPATSATIYQPSALALDGAGNLYIATPNVGTIRKVTASTGIITTIAGNGNKLGNSGDGGPAINAEIYPQALALDAAGNLYLSSYPYAVRKVDANTGLITTVVGTGYGAYGGDGGPATVAEISGPQGISFDAADNLYIADTANPRIRKVTFQVAATPVFSVTAGSYSSSQTVAISDSTQGATIYYTTDGTTPTTNSTVCAGPITVSSSETIKAIAAATGYAISGVVTASYTINIPVAAAPTFSPAAGTYSVTQTVTISDATAGATIHYTLDGSTPTTNSTVYAGPITVSSSETIKAIAAATGYTISGVAIASYTISIPVTAAPTFSPVAGTYSSTQTVTISDATAGATIHYTLDGTTPTTSSTVYAGPITMSSTTTIEAIATASGYNPGAASTATYTINTPTNAGPILSQMSPAFSAFGSTAFTLTVTGSGFTSGSTVYWGTTALSTQFGSSTQLTAQVPAASTLAAGIAAITVQTPAPGGETSNALQFEVDSVRSGSVASPSFSTFTATLASGSSATYAVNLPSSATNVSVTCLNLPTGASCSYSAAASAVTITTSATTPSGTYQITVVFTETLPGPAPAFVLIPLLLSPFIFVRRKLALSQPRFRVYLALFLLASAFGITACAGSGSGSTSTPSSHQVTSSAALTLTVR